MAIVTAHHADDQAESVLTEIFVAAAAHVACRASRKCSVNWAPCLFLRPVLGWSRQGLAAVAAAGTSPGGKTPATLTWISTQLVTAITVLPTLEAGVPGIAEELARRALARQNQHSTSGGPAAQLPAAAQQMYQRSGWLIELNQLPESESDRWPAWSHLADELGIACSRQWLAAFDGLCQGATGRRLDWRHLFERRKQGSDLVAATDDAWGLCTGAVFLDPGDYAQFQGWWLRNRGRQKVLLSMAEDGERWARGQSRAWRRDLAEASVPLLWRPLWPVVRNKEGELLGAPCVRRPREVVSVGGEVRLDCEWLGFKVMPTFHPP